MKRHYSLPDILKHTSMNLPIPELPSDDELSEVRPWLTPETVQNVKNHPSPQEGEAALRLSDPLIRRQFLEYQLNQ